MYKRQVCVIKRITENGEEEWLIEQRPDKGLLASLWQLPSHTVYTDEGKASAEDSGENSEDEEEDDDMPVKSRRKKAKPKTKIKPTSTTADPPTAKQRKQHALDFVNSVLQKSYDSDSKSTGKVEHILEAGSITHLFSHIKLIMHVHIFHLNEKEESGTETKRSSIKQAEYQQRKWASRKEVEEESFGTGMRKCWTLALKEENEARRQV